jgi:uncharacterized membrane protein YfcA
MVEFPISGVETYWFLPALVAFAISTFTSTGGVTGAFIILPFQVSVLGYTSPGASPTNMLYNIVAIPAGLYRLHREGRMEWWLALATGLGTIPGLIIGAALRILFLPDPKPFELFAGCVLLALAVKLVSDIMKKRPALRKAAANHSLTVVHGSLTAKHLSYTYGDESYSIPTMPLVGISFLVGIVGGAYGIGGGAILSPYLVAVYNLPVHSIAGAMLLGTWITSVFGIIVYMVVSPLIVPGQVVMPDWLLGLSFGVGGFAGVYLGARIQRFVPARIIKIILALGLLIIAGKYIGGYFLN